MFLPLLCDPWDVYGWEGGAACGRSESPATERDHCAPNVRRSTLMRVCHRVLYCISAFCHHLSAYRQSSCGTPCTMHASFQTLVHGHHLHRAHQRWDGRFVQFTQNADRLPCRAQCLENCVLLGAAGQAGHQHILRGTLTRDNQYRSGSVINTPSRVSTCEWPCIIYILQDVSRNRRCFRVVFVFSDR